MSHIMPGILHLIMSKTVSKTTIPPAVAGADQDTRKEDEVTSVTLKSVGALGPSTAYILHGYTHTHTHIKAGIETLDAVKVKV